MTKKRIIAYGHLFRERVRLSTTRVGYVFSHWNKSEHEHVCGKFPSNVEEVYLERKQNRRVDHLLSTLRKIARDKSYQQRIKAEKGKVTIRQPESTKRHRQAD